MDDGCVGFLMLGTVWVVAYRMTESRPAARGVGAKLGFLAAVGVGLLLFARGSPDGGADYFRILVQAVAAATAVSTALWIAVPAIDIATDPVRSLAAWAWHEAWAAILKRRERRHARELVRLVLASSRQRAKDEAERLAKLPPPPTREEKIAQVRKSHAAAAAELEASGLDALELSAAKERLKQKLLKDLDKVL
jgi:2,4-dienoyl-CoA reductase-like NADH-dependent reductase (Old Yellow Enzyme family)